VLCDGLRQLSHRLAGRNVYLIAIVRSFWAVMQYQAVSRS
jgi:hypothetical protein